VTSSKLKGKETGAGESKEPAPKQRWRQRKEYESRESGQIMGEEVKLKPHVLPMYEKDQCYAFRERENRNILEFEGMV
jgi:hypothetical protein